MPEEPKIKILFLNGSPELVKTMCGRPASERARQYGFEIAAPILNNENRTAWTEMLAEYDAAITCWGSPLVDGDLLQRAGNLKIIGHAAGSVCSAISEEVYGRGVKVTTANPVMAETVAEWSLLATLLAARNFSAYAQWFGSAPLRWEERDSFQDLRSMTVGIWGFGDISCHLLRMLAPLRPGRILVHSRHTPDAVLAGYGAVAASLEEVFASSDVIHLLAGLTPENLERIGRNELRAIKDGATLINAGRARLIEPKALLEELQKKRFKAMLDVFYQEPLPHDSPFRKLDNVILTPHNAGYPGRERYVPFLLDEIHRCFRGEPLLSEISPERYRTMTVERLAAPRPAAVPAPVAVTVS